jgi:hypothetical protein
MCLLRLHSTSLLVDLMIQLLFGVLATCNVARLICICGYLVSDFGHLFCFQLLLAQIDCRFL